MPVSGYQKGLWAETVASFYLLFKGYIPLARRHKTRLGEIDLVVRKGKTIVFVEVKLRHTQRAAAEAIHVENQQRIKRAATLYLQKHPEYTGHDIRFDAVIMVGGALPRHIKGAF